MSDFIVEWESGSVWPTTHFFLPALIFIYLDYEWWILLSIIYVFESAEYLVGLIPAFSALRSEKTFMDTIVFDIAMGVLGSAIVYVTVACLGRACVKVPMNAKKVE